MPDEVDLTFLGEQIRRLQADMRELKTLAARTDADVLALNEQLAAIVERLSALEGRVEIGFDLTTKRFLRTDERFDAIERRLEVIDSQIAEMRQENTRNLEVVLQAIQELKD